MDVNTGIEDEMVWRTLRVWYAHIVSLHQYNRCSPHPVVIEYNAILGQVLDNVEHENDLDGRRRTRHETMTPPVGDRTLCDNQQIQPINMDICALRGNPAVCARH